MNAHIEQLAEEAEDAGYDLYLAEAIEQVEGHDDQDLAEDQGIFTHDFLEAARDIAASNAEKDNYSRYEWRYSRQDQERTYLEKLLKEAAPQAGLVEAA